MPKKKRYTRIEIKKKYGQLMLLTAGLAIDKMEKSDSLVTQSVQSLTELNKKFTQQYRKYVK
jgi:hydrogenase maturation factor